MIYQVSPRHLTSTMNWVLRAAAIYNVLWGGFVVLFPNVIFQWMGMPLPNYPEIWQAVGTIIGVYGIGYWIAARDPHWPIVLVGFLGKLLGPIGFVTSTLPWRFGWINGTNDFIWWIPFAMILWKARAYHASTHA